jgi:hypothetical protein
MTAEQDQQIVNALNDIAYSLRYLLRYASAFASKLEVLNVVPPDPIADVPEKGGSTRRR